MGPITERQDELGGDEEDADVAQDVEDVLAAAVERVDDRVGETTSNKVESEVEVGEREEGEEQLQELVEELDVEQDLAGDGVVGVPDLLEVDQRVDGGEEGSVQPSSALRDELGDGVYMLSVSYVRDVA